MPISAVTTVSKREAVENGGFRFSNECGVKMEVPVDLWELLGNPDEMRIRIEDSWNDPNRSWTNEAQVSQSLPCQGEAGEI